MMLLSRVLIIDSVLIQQIILANDCSGLWYLKMFPFYPCSFSNIHNAWNVFWCGFRFYIQTLLSSSASSWPLELLLLFIFILNFTFHVMQYGFIAWLLSTSVGLLLSFLRYKVIILNVLIIANKWFCLKILSISLSHSPSLGKKE